MNFRRSTVKEHHPQTFEWIFRDRQIKYDHELESLAEEFDSELDLEPNSDSESTLSGPPSNSARVDEDDTLDQTSDDTSPAWDSFVKWLHNDDKTYWVSGKAGAGKSTLMLFLLRDARTHRHLGEWNPDTLVLNHFLLSSGHPLQRNTRGIYCSLLHQILADDYEHDGLLLSLVASRFPRVLSKDVSDDWAEWELKDATLTALKQSKRSLCIFIDGLDELVASEIEDGHLWTFLQGLERIPNLKLCLSSRPEPRFRDYFEGTPKLQMQLLTDGDIRRYATKFLSANISFKKHQEQQHDVGRFVDIISERANGVFLWVYMVLKRLQRGITNNDTVAMLNRRLEETPKELYSLFEDMWGRMGEDAEISEYLTLAARYFHLVNRTKSCRLYNGLKIAELMLATERGVLRDILEGNEHQVTLSRIEGACIAVMQNIDTCCAGLLEYRNDTLGMANSHTDEFYHGRHTVDFVHRSVRDFLFTTQEGTKIIAYDISTLEDQLSLLCQARIAAAILLLLPYQKDFSGPLTGCLESLAGGRTSHEIVLSQRRIQALISLGGFAYSRERLRGLTSPERRVAPGAHGATPFLVDHPDFVVVSSRREFAGWVPHYLSMLDQKISPDYAGYLVMCICRLYYNNAGRILWADSAIPSKDWFAAIRYLVDRDANLTLEGFDLGTVIDGSWLWDSNYTQLQSAAIYLIQALHTMNLSRQKMSTLFAVVETLSTLADAGANLARPMIAHFTHQTNYDRSSFYEVQDLSAMNRDGLLQETLFFTTTPGYLLRLTLSPEFLQRQGLPSSWLGDLEIAVRNLVDHEVVAAAPPMLNIIGVEKWVWECKTDFRRANTNSQTDRISVLFRSFAKDLLGGHTPWNDLDTRWDEMVEILDTSESVSSLHDLEKELVREKLLVLKDDYWKDAPSLGAEQEAILIERMREDALEGLGEFGNTDI